MPNIYFQQIIDNIEHIGTQPAVILKILEKSQCSDIDIQTISELLMEDPTICAQILKMANSVYFSRGSKIPTIKQAVIHLGIANIRNILFAITILGRFNCHFHIGQFDETNFWKHSVAGGMIALNYAIRQNWTDPDSFYIAALLRNIGILAIRQYMPNEFESLNHIVNNQKVSFETATRLLFDISHRTITYMIGCRWNLPLKIINSFDIDLTNDNSPEVNKIRTTIDIADFILEKTDYARWDQYCNTNFCNLDDAEVKSLTTDVYENTEKLFLELWN